MGLFRKFKENKQKKENQRLHEEQEVIRQRIESEMNERAKNNPLAYVDMAEIWAQKQAQKAQSQEVQFRR